MVKLGGFLDKLLGFLLKIGLLFIGNFLKPLAKSVLVALGLTPAAIQKKYICRKQQHY